MTFQNEVGMTAYTILEECNGAKIASEIKNNNLDTTGSTAISWCIAYRKLLKPENQTA